jgi:hypothetical protein
MDWFKREKVNSSGRRIAVLTIYFGKSRDDGSEVDRIIPYVRPSFTMATSPRIGQHRTRIAGIAFLDPRHPGLKARICKLGGTPSHDCNDVDHLQFQKSGDMCHIRIETCHLRRNASGPGK